MVGIIAYFGISYAVLALVFVFVLRGVYKRITLSGRIRRILQISIAALVILLPLLPYLLVEFNTLLHKSELQQTIDMALKKDNVTSPPKVFKVLGYNKKCARIYVVSAPRNNPSKPFGEIIELHKGKYGWVRSGEADTVWSSGGNANGVIFPPYPD